MPVAQLMAACPIDGSLQPQIHTTVPDFTGATSKIPAQSKITNFIRSFCSAGGSQ